MSSVLPGIDTKLATWLGRQPVFFVATAPLSAEGHINVSPKGMAGTLAVLGEHRVAYLDYTGSGTETLAHLRENGRIVIMFCAFEGKPQIVRLHGRGRAVFAADPDFDELRAHFDKERTAGQRSIIVVEVERVSDSCGYAVPLMEFQSDRDVLDRHQERHDQDYYDLYWRNRNGESIDGLPGVALSSG